MKCCSLGEECEALVNTGELCCPTDVYLMLFHTAFDTSRSSFMRRTAHSLHTRRTLDTLCITLCNCSRYITGSMWRSYAKGERMICGIPLPDGLKKDTILPELLITPSTKGVLRGIPGVPEMDDVNVSLFVCLLLLLSRALLLS